MRDPPGQSLRIAIVGTGISGLSAAWLLSQRHDVFVYERAGRPGGHSNTVIVREDESDIPIDTGFIVYNPATYPNLVALFDYFDVPTAASDMSFSVSLRDGGLEYSGASFAGLFAQKRNAVSPRFWTMLGDVRRFYRQARLDLPTLDEDTTLGDYLAAHRYTVVFRQDHLVPMASAIWSAPAAEIFKFPAAAFIRFHDNHGLLRLTGRPIWRTVGGSSRTYVDRLSQTFRHRIRLANGVRSALRAGGYVDLLDTNGNTERFDHVVIATHADQALGLLDKPTEIERDLLGTFRYSRNVAVLHSDPSFMPKRQSAWASWNYLDGTSDSGTRVTYWMNSLQNIKSRKPYFVTLNPPRAPAAESVVRREIYDHPLFDLAALMARRNLWKLQGKLNTWFCGAYFGASFHEDGLQSGLAVAEALGGVRRPWQVKDESSRIALPPLTAMEGFAV
jgi:hypothetical protein